MKLVIIAIIEHETFTGVLNKIIQQEKHLKGYFDIHMILFIDKNLKNCDESIKVFNINNFNKNRLIGRLFRAMFIREKIKKVLAELSHTDFLYIRGTEFSFFYLPHNFYRLFREYRIICEFQTIEIEQYRLGNHKLAFYREKLFGKLLRNQFDGIVGVTDEITHYQLFRSGDPQKPHITIGNGIDVDSIDVRQQVPYNGKEIHLLCVASVSRWHGLDRLIRGLGTYPGPTKVIFHIAGVGAEILNLKKLINDLNIPDQVIFHGLTTGKDLDDLFNSCHIAVGSLGIHRKGLRQTSELKAREYCARGIPYIIACADPDFPDDFPFILRIPADETPVNIEQVIKFAQRVYNEPEHPQKMRAFAVKYLDWSVKMKILKIFLEDQIVGSKQN